MFSFYADKACEDFLIGNYKAASNWVRAHPVVGNTHARLPILL